MAEQHDRMKEIFSSNYELMDHAKREIAQYEAASQIRVLAGWNLGNTLRQLPIYKWIELMKTKHREKLELIDLGNGRYLLALKNKGIALMLDESGQTYTKIKHHSKVFLVYGEQGRTTSNQIPLFSTWELYGKNTKLLKKIEEAINAHQIEQIYMYEIADHGYENISFRDEIEKMGVEIVIRPDDDKRLGLDLHYGIRFG